MIEAGIQFADYRVEVGARSFSDYAKATASPVTTPSPATPLRYAPEKILDYSF